MLIYSIRACSALAIGSSATLLWLLILHIHVRWESSF
jgi:hypothetical protein